MARPPRLQIANGFYHVTARGNERGLIYRDDTDRRRFLELLADNHGRYGWRILAYCLMPNHYHLLTQTPKPNLASGMRQLNGVYAQSFNCRHVRVGHVLQGRYSARLVQADEHLLSVVRYIVRNPVRAGLCDTPGEWPWSSHRATLRSAPAWLDTPALFCHYAPTREAAREHYRTHVAQPDEDAMSRHPLVEGDAGFIASTLAGLEPAPGIPHRYFAGQRPVLGSLLGSSQPEAIAAAHAYGYSLREIARHLGVNASTISRRLRRHTVRRTQTNASTPD